MSGWRRETTDSSSAEPIAREEPIGCPTARKPRMLMPTPTDES